jgi:TolB-like protein/class 3 adenylate cyclase/Tfp pilus assembly protein PilF
MADILEPSSRKRKLAAILHADVVGFSRLMGVDEAGTHRALGELRGAIDPLIVGSGGRIVGTAGDSLLADFSSVVDALTCAVEMQRAARAVNDGVAPDRRLELRIGLNLGDVIVDGDDIFGDGVNIAARLEALARPGTVCISQSVYDQVKNKLALDYRPLGSQQVKNISEPIRAYAVGIPAVALRPRRVRRPVLAAAGTLALVVAGLVAWALLAGAGRELLGLAAAPRTVEVASLTAPSRLAGRPSVAVLPFRNLSGDAAQDYFSDGITEDVTTALGRFSNLLVIAKWASFQFKGSNASPAEVGRLLDARYLLEGSIRRAGDRLRVNAELTEAARGLHVWSETYDTGVRDIFAVQDDIARRVVGAAAVTLTRFEAERVLTKPTENLAAYEYVLRGREFLSHATRESNDEAAALFQRAIDLDPNYAAAYAALGGSHYEAVTSGWTEFSRAELEQAETLGQKALALDPTTTSAYRLLARVNLYRRLFELALGQIDRALEINPADADNYELRGIVLAWAGRPAEAVSWLEAALRFDGANTTPVNLCVAYYLLERYSEAVQSCDRALARNPGHFLQSIVHPVLAAAYAQMGRDQDGQRERTIVLHQWPLFDAGRFAAQFGTQEVRNQMLEGLKKAGFH